jgi:hypothetical protein
MSLLFYPWDRTFRGASGMSRKGPEGDIVPCRKVIATSQTLSHLRLCKKETQRKRMAAIQIPLFPAAIDFDLSGLAKWIEGIV